MTTIERKRSKLQAQLADLEQEEMGIRSRQKFKCSCGKMHQIGKCTVVQTYWYTPPHGCTGGDYWNAGELQIICPLTNVRNRVMFNESYYRTKYELRDNYDYSAEKQFSRQYRHLFAALSQDYDEYRGPTFNNYYFDQNHEKFGIYIPEDGKGL